MRRRNTGYCRRVMRNRTKKACQICGNSFYGLRDNFYCPKCAREKKLDTVVRIRHCQDCGVEFFGGPRAKRCPECAYKARKENKKHYQSCGAKRPIGSIDYCQWCGKEYIVNSGRQKYCSDTCQRQAVLLWQREHKKDYYKKPEQIKRKQERRKNAEKICVYCGRKFSSSRPTNTCSEYCRKEQKKISLCISDINRGRNRNFQKYIDARNEYRKEVEQSKTKK